MFRRAGRIDSMSLEIKDCSTIPLVVAGMALVMSVGSWIYANHAKNLARQIQVSTPEIEEMYAQRGMIDARMIVMREAITKMQGGALREQQRRDAQLNERAARAQSQFDGLRTATQHLLKAQADRAKHTDERMAAIGDLLINILKAVQGPEVVGGE